MELSPRSKPVVTRLLLSSVLLRWIHKTGVSFLVPKLHLRSLLMERRWVSPSGLSSRLCS